MLGFIVLGKSKSMPQSERMKTLICFAKEPRPGEVKTRLAAKIGAVPAARLYASFLKEIAAKLPQCGADRLIIASPGAHPKPRLDQIFPAPLFLHRKQRGETLGQRMSKSFEESFAEGGTRVVMIGSDSPHFPIAEVHRTFDLLDQRDAVVGPALDGGFWLVGLRRYAELFSALPLSTPRAQAALLQELQADGLSYEEVEICADIDTIEDVKRFLAHEESGPRFSLIRS